MLKYKQFLKKVAIRMKRINDKTYEADEGKIIKSKVTGMKYNKIVISQNDSIDQYEEISESTKKWGKNND